MIFISRKGKYARHHPDLASNLSMLSARSKKNIYIFFMNFLLRKRPEKTLSHQSQTWTTHFIATETNCSRLADIPRRQTSEGRKLKLGPRKWGKVRQITNQVNYSEILVMFAKGIFSLSSPFLYSYDIAT